MTCGKMSFRWHFSPESHFWSLQALDIMNLRLVQLHIPETIPGSDGLRNSFGTLHEVPFPISSLIPDPVTLPEGALPRPKTHPFHLCGGGPNHGRWGGGRNRDAFWSGSKRPFNILSLFSEGSSNRPCSAYSVNTTSTSSTSQRGSILSTTSSLMELAN